MSGADREFEQLARETSRKSSAIAGTVSEYADGLRTLISVLEDDLQAAEEAEENEENDAE